MNTRNNITLNHSKETETIGTHYYELVFDSGAIHKSVNDLGLSTLREGSDNMGGYLVPDTMEKRIIDTLTENNVMRRLATVIHTEGNERRIPMVTAMSEAQWLTENEPMQTAEAEFSALALKAHKLGIMIQVTNELVNDAGMDMASFLADTFAERIASTEEAAFITGDGTTMPKGVLASAQVGVTAAGTDAITADEIVALYYSLDEKYREHAVFMMHDDTAKALQLLKDENGRYIWQDALDDTMAGKLLGRPVYISRHMPQMDAEAKPVLFGDLSKYWIGDRGNRSFRRFDELFADQGQTGFRMTERVDGKLLIPEAVKVIRMAAE